MAVPGNKDEKADAASRQRWFAILVRARKFNTTTVDFFTLVRGEDLK